MIYQLSGTVSKQAEDFIVLSVAGVGYQVFVPENESSQWLPSEHVKTLYTFHYIREDQQVLYGFSEEETRQLFSVLTSVSGIGPKVAMKMIGTLNPTNLITAILKGDIPALTSIPGIGKKGAERCVVELKDKLSTFSLPASIDLSDTLNTVPVANPLTEDLHMALKTLGYHQDEIKRALKQSQQDLHPDMTLEQGIKTLLKQL